MNDPRRPGGLAIPVAILTLLSTAAFAQTPVIDPPIDQDVAVRLRPGASIAAYVARHGIARVNPQLRPTHEIPSRDMYLVTLAGRVPPGGEEQFINDVLEPDPDTVWAERDYAADGPEGTGRNFYCTVLPSPSAYLGQPAWNQVGVGTAHQVTMGGGVDVAVIDSGIDASHPVFAGRLLPGGWNFFENNGDVSDVGDGVDNDGDGDTDELVGHGTHMSGIVTYIAPESKILPIKVLDSEGNTTTFTLAAGMFYAIDRGVDVMNISIGSTYDAKGVEDALDEALAGGIVVVGAAGNVNTAEPREYPATRPEAIGVAAVDEGDFRALFSNYAPMADPSAVSLSSPGLHIFSPIPNNMYADLDGTSPATALVSGTAALLIAAHPEWQPGLQRALDVRQILQESAFNIYPLNPGFVGQLGAGRLDAGRALNTTVLFSPPQPTPTGAGPAAAATADLDGDGTLDMAVCNAGASSVSILLGNGDGTFRAGGTYGVGPGPDDIVAADLDGDFDTDLATANAGGASVSVLRNNGNGTFAPAASFAAGDEPVGIVAGDWDGDNHIDLATADEDGGTVSILRNNGAAVFTRIASPFAGSRPHDIASGHFNGDARPDIAVANRDSNDVAVLINQGNGIFAPRVSYPVGEDARWLLAADFDGDGDDDLLAAVHDARDLARLTCNGNGTFSVGGRVDVFVGRKPDTMVAADFDCDGDTDVAVLNGDPPLVVLTLLLNDGDGSFPAFLNMAPDATAINLAAGDADNDGDPEMMVINSPANHVGVMVNNSCVLAGDVNCDGSIDAFDIEPFILALTDPAAYGVAYPDCPRGSADANGDGLVDAFDIEPFIALLVGP